MASLPSTSGSMLRVTPSTPIDRAADSTSIDVNSHAPLLTLDVAAAITLALSRCGLSQKDAALTMGLDPAQWSRQLHGEGHVSMQRLQRLPVEFWREFLPLLGGPIRLTLAHQDAVDLAMLRIVALVQEIGAFALSIRALDRRSA